MTIEELKKLQLKIIKKAKTCNKICISIIVIIIIITNFMLLSNTISIINHQIIFMNLFISFFELIFGLIITIIIKNIVNSKDISIFDKEYKNVFVLKKLQNTFDNLTYNAESGFDEEIIEQTRMMYTGDSYLSNDYISGTYKNINFEQSDIHVQIEQESEDSDGNKTTTWVTIFKGRWMIFDFNKKFKSNIQIVSSDFYAESSPWKIKPINMEDIEFNKKFKIYTKNAHDAFYVLTPHFMEKIKKIDNELNCGIMLCFMDNKLHIAIDNRDDSFEYDVYKEINEEEIEKDISKDIELITDFVNDLDLDDNLFKRK